MAYFFRAALIEQNSSTILFINRVTLFDVLNVRILSNN